MSQAALDALKAKFGDAVRSTLSAHGDESALIDPTRNREILGWLKSEGFDMLVDLSVLDTLGLDAREHGRFEVVYSLRNMTSGRRLRIKAAIDLGVSDENPRIDSVLPLWKGANWFEREAFDMYGVEFVGHGDLRRILMYEEFIGHPMRKDYPKDRRQPLVRRDFT